MHSKVILSSYALYSMYLVSSETFILADCISSDVEEDLSSLTLKLIVV